MSVEEKSAWIVSSAMVIVYGWYFTVVFGQVDSVDLRDIAYKTLMVVTVVALIVMIGGAHVVAALVNPKEADRIDERDREINRRAEYVGGYVLGTGAFAALILAMVEVDHFWIANAILVALVLSEVVAGVTRIVLYRRGM